ncbi:MULTISPECIES: hypothetical protein [Muribaculaceae]|uniref:hypothetical protein n=1 Tax=Muribaculaceae TaxID=2005473 RepID=UPI0025B66FF1|nr:MULTISPECIES: hypothetical protein [Muribaculaceae]
MIKKKGIHISQARKMLDSGQPVELTVVRLKDGSLIHYKNAVSLRYDYYKGTRNIKQLKSGQIRTIHDVCIIGIDDFEVYL